MAGMVVGSAQKVVRIMTVEPEEKKVDAEGGRQKVKRRKKRSRSTMLGPSRAGDSGAAGSSPVLVLDTIDIRLKARRLMLSAVPVPGITPLTLGSSGGDDALPQFGQAEPLHSRVLRRTDVEPTRSLEECVDIFENGPEPRSAALGLLNDEEVVLLARNGKITMGELDRVLSAREFETAVRIRSDLISRVSRTETLDRSDIPLSNHDELQAMGMCSDELNFMDKMNFF